MATRLEAVHDSKSLGSFVLIWRSASNLKPTWSAATIFLWWNVSMLSMTTRAKEHRYWFEEVCFEYEANGFCNNHLLIVKRFNVVNGSQGQGTSVLIWRGLLQIWNQRFLQQLFSYCESSQCCPWQPKPMIICTDLTRSASNLKPTLSATLILLFWNVSMLSMTSTAHDHRHRFGNVSFDSETTGFCNNHVLVLKRFGVVHENKNPW